MKLDKYRVIQKEYAKIIMRYVKNEKYYKTLAWIHVLYIHSSFISCFTSAQYGQHRQHGQHQTIREFVPNGLDLLEVVEHKLCL